MRPAIGGFHIFPALRLVVMPSPYITEITPEMQQKIKIFAEKVFRHKKAKSAQAFLLQKSIPAAPCKGLAYGPQAARRTRGQANRRFASAAPPPGLRPAPALRTTPPPTQGEGCVKGGPSAGPPFAFNQGTGQDFAGGMRSPRPQKRTPRPNAQARPTGGKDSVKENRQGCLSRFIRAGAFKSAKRYALPPAPKKNAPMGAFFFGAADGN